eukprot:PITA_08676
MASLCAGALSFLMVLQAVAAYQFSVGGGNGWVPPSGTQESYNQWAGRNRFQVGDLLVFKYNPNEDSVLQVNSQDYEACKTTNPVAHFKDGNTVFKFPKHGPFYFISGNATNCQKGEKLVIVVMAPRNTIHVGSPSLAPASTAVAPTPVAVAPSVATPSPAPSAATPTPTPSRATPAPAPSKAAPSPAPSVAPPTPVPAPVASVPSPSPVLSPPAVAPSPSAPVVASPQPSQENGGEPSLPPAASITESTSLAASSSSVSAAATVVALLMWGLAMATF